MKCDELKDYDYDPDFPFQSRGRFYDADEVDAAIAELKAAHHKERHEYINMIAELKADYKESCDRLQTANLIKDEQLAATRHSKRKRCLNKAEWCEERCARYDLLEEKSGFRWRREIDFYFRWHQRWLALAEQFKEGV